MGQCEKQAENDAKMIGAVAGAVAAPLGAWGGAVLGASLSMVPRPLRMAVGGAAGLVTGAVAGLYQGNNPRIILASAAAGSTATTAMVSNEITMMSTAVGSGATLAAGAMGIPTYHLAKPLLRLHCETVKDENAALPPPLSNFVVGSQAARQIPA